jgi:MFS transporter, ACDE family, multidrug resistance protein
MVSWTALAWSPSSPVSSGALSPRESRKRFRLFWAFGETVLTLGRVSRRPPLAFIFTVTLTGILNNTLVTPAIPDILEELGQPLSRAGLLVAAGSVAGIAVAPIGGLLADRFGRRIVLTSALGIFGVFGGLAAVAPTFEILLAARLLQGVGSAALINLAVVLIGDNWTGIDRTRLIGRNSAVLTIGLASIPLLSGIVTEGFGWRVTFAIYTVALGTAAAAWVVLDGRKPPNPPRFGEQFGEAFDVLKRPILVASLLAGFLVFIAIFGLFLTVFPVHLAETFGMRAGLRGLIISLPAVTATLASLSLGRMRTTTSARNVVIVSAVALIVAYLTIGTTTLLALVILATLVYGASEGFFIPLLQDLNLEDAPDEHRAVVIAVWVGFARLGQTIGPLLAGVGMGVLGTGGTFVAGAGVAVAILLVGWFGPFPRTRVGTATHPSA